jgi:hypothetical protein
MARGEEEECVELPLSTSGERVWERGMGREADNKIGGKN